MTNTAVGDGSSSPPLSGNYLSRGRGQHLQQQQQQQQVPSLIGNRESADIIAADFGKKSRVVNEYYNSQEQPFRNGPAAGIAAPNLRGRNEFNKDNTEDRDNNRINQFASREQTPLRWV